VSASYFVHWTDPVSDFLAAMWVTSTNPDALVSTRNAIQYLLESNPHKHGTPVAEGLWKLTLPPLQVYFNIDSPNMRVEITDVYEIG
jgi:hypothetical protein